jgi:hypothetical protein
MNHGILRDRLPTAKKTNSVMVMGLILKNTGFDWMIRAGVFVQDLLDRSEAEMF